MEVTLAKLIKKDEGRERIILLDTTSFTVYAHEPEASGRAGRKFKKGQKNTLWNAVELAKKIVRDHKSKGWEATMENWKAAMEETYASLTDPSHVPAEPKAAEMPPPDANLFKETPVKLAEIVKQELEGLKKALKSKKVGETA